MTLLVNFWRFHTGQMQLYSLQQPPFSPLPFLFGRGICVPLLFDREHFYSSVQIALLLPAITGQCPATQINGLLSGEHERGGLMVDRRQRRVFSFQPQRQTVSIIRVPYRTSVNHSCQQRRENITQLGIHSLHSVATSYSAGKSKLCSL